MSSSRNATLQWVPGHLDLLPALVARVNPGGWLAFQVPGNFGEPSHTIRTELAAEAPYAAHTAGVAVPSSHDPVVYLEALQRLGCAVDAWETTYLHVLEGEDPVFTWVSGTGARPTLQALPDDLRPGFEEEFKRRLRAAYPARDGRVVLPFRRIFVVAQTSAQVVGRDRAPPRPGRLPARRRGRRPRLLRRRARPARGREARRPARARRRVVPRVRRAAARSPQSSMSVSRSRSCPPARRTRRSWSTTSTPVAARLRRLGFEVDETERETFPGYLRFHTFDPHGNRVEVLQELSGA